jgi:hypothetical protein
MIVKNESKIIENTLNNLCNYIDFSYYVISDTGSTDNTVQIIKNFFISKNINGEIFNDEWKDFGTNRSLALKYALKKTDYLLIFDADDKIYGDFKIPEILNYDSYFLKFGNDFKYTRILLINNQIKWEFYGVLHEYIKCNELKQITETILEGDYYIESGKYGSRSNDVNKYYNDALILEKAYYDALAKNNFIYIRYAFYIAQSYKDCNQKEKAIKWYKKRASFKNYLQEIYYSYYIIGVLYNDLNEHENAIYYWMLAYDSDPERYESIYQIITHFRKNNNINLAYKYYLMIDRHKNININEKLFLIRNIYDYLLDYEMTIIFFYVKKYEEAINIFNKLFLTKNIELHLKQNIINNFIFYIDYIVEENNFNLFENYLNFIKDVPKTNENIINIEKIINKISFTQTLNNVNILNIIKNKLKNKDGNENINIFLSITTCKRYELFVKTINSLLVCCKDLFLIDYFFCIDDNSSEEDIKNMHINYPFFNFYFKKSNELGHNKSMNIIWNKLNELKPKYWIHLEDDWLFVKPCNYIKKSIDFLDKYCDKNIHQVLFNKNYAETFNDYNFVGGEKLDNDFILHIKDEKNLIGMNCAYWPHYSFRPSICIVDTILKLGDFHSDNTFFEKDYADKYYNNGYKSAFFNEITCIHIGKLTLDTNYNNKNAYELNNMKQY